MSTKPVAVPLPRLLIGTLTQPVAKGATIGNPAAHVQVDVLAPIISSATTGGSASPPVRVATGLTDSAGNFQVSLPSGFTVPASSSLTLNVFGSAPAGPHAVQVAIAQIAPLGYLGSIPLSAAVSPIPTSIYNALQTQLGSMSLGSTPPAAPTGSTPPVTLGGTDGDCVRVLENQTSSDRFPFGVFFRFSDPTLYSEKPAPSGTDSRGDPVLQETPPAVTLRSQLSGPISVDQFRYELVNGMNIVGSLSIGYVLRVAQHWEFEGLALGDLVYSLPLAPGEQQQVVVVEQQSRLQVSEQEQVSGSGRDSSTAVGDSSTVGTFKSALNLSAQAQDQLNSQSFQVAGGAGGGLIGVIGGPSVSGSYNQQQASQNSSMSGAQNFASDATQSVQTYSEQQAASTRRALRTAMRLASSSESTSVTTKTITNHNHTRALTLQYFEVLRMFDISTVYEGVDLVCLVPMDIIWWLPYGQGARLQDALETSTEVSQVVQLSAQIAAILQTLANSLIALVASGQVGSIWGFPSSFIQNGANAANNLIGQAVADTKSLSTVLATLVANPGGSGITAAQSTAAAALAAAEGTIQTDITLMASQGSVTTATQAASDAQAAAATAQALSANIWSLTGSSPSTYGGMSRQEVMARYQAIIDHSDVLEANVPLRFRSALTRLERFAADPSSLVVLNSLAEDVIQISANATVLPFDHVYVTARTRWGTRLGPVELLPSPPVTIPGQDDITAAFATAQDLTNYLVGRRRPWQSVLAGGASVPTPTVSASLVLPNSMSPSDVIGFEITHNYDPFTYSLAPATNPLFSAFGSDATKWPSFLGSGVLDLFGTPNPPPASFTPGGIAQTIGPPYLSSFQANLVASQSGNTETYARPNPSPVELPAGPYTVPAAEVAPVLKYSDLLHIEALLQHVLRNVIPYSKAVWASLTAEERVMLLDQFLFYSSGSTQIPLMDCVGNQVLGYFGNSLIMPFSIPQALAQNEQWKYSTGDLESDLLAFHQANAPQTVTRVTLPTQGVLGEAMLGHCPSAEKIDLTRFWNWQDSPSDSAPAIAPVTVPGSQIPTLANASAPNALGSMLGTLVNNVNAPAPPTVGALAQTLAQQAPANAIPNLSNLPVLEQLAQAGVSANTSAINTYMQTQAATTQAAISAAGSVLSSALGGGSGAAKSATPG
ncbi:MAG: hypothetical protein ACHQ2Y_07605, partial [Candidatus Lutacidiplasmatales archaeon]